MRLDQRWWQLVVLFIFGVCFGPARQGFAQQTPDAPPVDDGTQHPRLAKVWDGKGSSDVLVLKGHDGGVTTAMFFQSGEKVLTASSDRTARVWDARTGKTLVVIDNAGFNRCFASVDPQGTRILTTNHPYVKLWDANTGAVLMDLTGQVGLERHWPFGFRGVFSPDGKWFTTCSPVFQLKLRESTTGKELATLKGSDYWSNDSAVSPDGSRVVTSCETSDDAARVWDSRTGAELLTLKGHGGSVWAVGFSPDGQQIATGGVDRKIHLWDAKTGAEQLRLEGHTRVVTSVAFRPDGKQIVSTSQDGTTRIWDSKTGEELFILAKADGDARFSPDGKRIVTASSDRTALIWDYASFLARPRNP